MLLTRDEFRKQVFARDGHKCVHCGAAAQDAHHIVERRLWPDGGYYLDNGVSVCGPCHLLAEETALSCDSLRAEAGIKGQILPPQFYEADNIDKWGNPILPSGHRLKGELFFDLSVHGVVKSSLHMFVNRVKYPRTFHLPWSPGVTDEDKLIPSLDAFEGKEVVVTLKMDGEQTTMYQDGIHARSLDGYSSHPSRDRVRALHASIAHDIPFAWRICGENVDAVHSIAYKSLPARFLVFSIWDEVNRCLGWDETALYASVLGLQTVPVLWRGVWDVPTVQALYKPFHDGDETEGYVVRPSASFHFREFRQKVAKFVRKGHVRTQNHWLRQYRPNGLKTS